jgi:hypothetical protein
MATRHTLSDLRNSIQEIHRKAMLERSDGEAATVRHADRELVIAGPPVMFIGGEEAQLSLF